MKIAVLRFEESLTAETPEAGRMVIVFVDDAPYTAGMVIAPDVAKFSADISYEEVSSNVIAPTSPSRRKLSIATRILG
jgi:hypothetical protein